MSSKTRKSDSGSARETSGFRVKVGCQFSVEFVRETNVKELGVCVGESSLVFFSAREETIQLGSLVKQRRNGDYSAV